MTTTTENQPTVAVPDTLAKVAGELNAAFGKHDRAVAKAVGTLFAAVLKGAQAFFAEVEAWAIANGCVTKGGRVNLSKAHARLVEAGQEMPSWARTNQLRNIGKAFEMGVLDIEAYRAASWTAPVESVPEGVKPETFTNAESVDRLAIMAGYLLDVSIGKDKGRYILVDGVLMTPTEHERRCQTHPSRIEPEPEPVEVEGSDGTAADAVESSGDAVYGGADAEPGPITNVINSGALAAVFARCDNDTVAASITVDLSSFGEDVETLGRLALSAIAALELATRTEAMNEAVDAVVHGANAM